MDNYVQLTKETVEEYVKNSKIIRLPENLPKEFYFKKSGIFVTIWNGKELRGCIGTFLPSKENIAQEIISNAVASCSRDYRFNPINEKEFAKLRYEVSVLSEPEPVKDIGKHNPKKHGIIVRSAEGKCGLLLPNLDGIDSTEQQIDIACQKGNIDPQNDDIKLFYFTVEKHG